MKCITETKDYSLIKKIIGIIYYIISLFFVIYFNRKIFDLNLDINCFDLYYRLIWCYSFGLLGFFVLIVKIVNNKTIASKKNSSETSEK